jgi:hypothetical protein
VAAFRSELDRWLKSDGGATAHAEDNAPLVRRRHSSAKASELKRTVERCHNLCAQMQQNLLGITGALAQYSMTLEALRACGSSEKTLSVCEPISVQAAEA